MMKIHSFYAVLFLFLFPGSLPAVEIHKDLFYSQEDYAVGDNIRNPGKIGPIALGDVNGDGYDDLVMGAPYAIRMNQVDTGIAYVRFGLNFGAGTGFIQEKWYDLSTTYTQTSDPTVSSVNFPDGHGRLGGAQINGEVAGQRFGSEVACGDFDGDGIDDIAISMAENLSPLVPGRVYVLKGRTDIAGTIDLAMERSLSRSFYITGRRNGDRFGEKLFFSDFNNDGKEDLVIGTPKGGDGGEVDVFYGRDFSPFFYQNVDSLPQPHTAFFAENSGDELGWSFTEGDFTGDGLSDLCIGAPHYSAYSDDAGIVYMLQGTDDIAFQRGVVEIDETTRTLKIVSNASQEQLGFSLASGDLNADGFLDLAIGAPTWGLDISRTRGCVYVLFNESDRFDITGSNLIVITQDETRFLSQFDETMLGAKIAFFDLDHQYGPELLITAPEASPHDRFLAGESWVIQSRNPSLPFDPIYYYVQNYEMGLYIKGQESGDYFGSQIAVGDFNGDSCEDIFFTGGKGLNTFGKSAWGVFGGSSYKKTAIESPFWIQYDR
ncbi:FG-GAP repeat protein [Candidatus Sumerlaeota bacterium]|nr:FG-GAP repeat protein [Candidatus Sumerlaeota bacterium]